MPGLSARQRTAALAVLGLPPEASQVEITHAFRRLARATHPDATGRSDADAGRRFVAITDAYHRLLPDPEPTTPPPPPPRPQRPSTTVSASGAADRSWRARPPLIAGPVSVTPSPNFRRRSR